MLNLKTQNFSSNLKSNVKHRAYHFSLSIIKFCSEFPEKKVFWIISDQLLRSASSIGANLVEAISASSKKDFIKYYEIALKSANETKYWISLLKDSELIVNNNIDDLFIEIEEISKMIAASLLTMKGKR